MLGPLLFILYTADLFSVVSYLLVGYADDATLISIAQRPANRVAVSNSLQSDINTIGGWCHRWREWQYLIHSRATLIQSVVGVIGGV